MRPFNLEQAKEGKPVCTRNGKPARIIAYDLKGGFHKLVVLVQDHEGNEDVYTYTELGEYIKGCKNPLDLFMAEPKKYEGYVNVLYGNKAIPFIMGAAIFQSYEEATGEGKKRDDYVATVKIYFEV